MPCYLVQTCKVDLANADQDRLTLVLEKLGYQVQRNTAGQIVSFTKGPVTGTYDGKQLQFKGPKNVPVDANAILRGYAEETLRKKANDARNKGWTVTREGNVWKFSKPQIVKRVHA